MFKNFSKSQIIIAAVLAVLLISGGIFAFSQLKNQNNSQNLSQISLPNSVSNSSFSSSNSTNSNSNSAQNSSQISTFSTNSQTNSPLQNSQNSQIQPLVADNDHDVVVLDDCDLAVRYEKSKAKMTFYNNGNQYYGLRHLDDNREENAFTLECSNKSIKKIGKNGPLNDDSTEMKKYFEKIGISQAKNITQNLFATGNSEFYFEYGNKYYDLIQTLRTNTNYTFQFNSLAPSTPSVKLDNSQNSSTSSAIPSKKCDALECFAGKIGNQAIIIKKITDEGAGAGSSYFSGTLTYTSAGNTPIPIKWRQINSVDCGSEGIYLCKNITIEENVENGGTITKDIKYNKNTQKEEIGETKWTSKDGKTTLKAEFTKVETI